MPTIVAFNYEALKGKQRTEVRAQAARIRELVKSTTAALIEIGRRLREVRTALGPSAFWEWVEAEFRWSRSVASNYMRVAERFGSLKCADHFMPSALYALVRNGVDEKAVDECVRTAQAGETITKARAQEIIGRYPHAQRADTGRIRKPTTAIERLRETLDKFAEQLEEITGGLDRDEREALADRFLELGMSLRSIGRAA
jgi:hypothetical protein